MEDLLERSVQKKHRMNSGAGIAAALVGLVLGIILAVGVALPITNDVVANAVSPTGGNVTGTTKTVIQTIPIFVGLIPLLLVAAFF